MGVGFQPVAVSCLLLFAAAGALWACSSEVPESPARPSLLDFATTRTCTPPPDNAVWIDGGSFIMGSNAVYAEEGPERETTVEGFWMDPHEVTNRQFAEFVAATAYVTIAEKEVDPDVFGVPVEQIPPHMLEPGSAVFTPPQRPSRNYADWWEYVPGANWKRPYGPDGPVARPDQPVVHLGWEDMAAYAEWRGGRIPTEAEWEFAASAGAAKYTEQPGSELANSWQGIFPVANEASDGFKGIAPVGCFRPNAFGLHDMVGNVWEVTADLYQPGHNPDDSHNPQGPRENPEYNAANSAMPYRVMKGGSYLCAPNYCQRYRPESRQGRDPGMGASNVGFRLVYDSEPAGGSGGLQPLPKS